MTIEELKQSIERMEDRIRDLENSEKKETIKPIEIKK